MSKAELHAGIQTIKAVAEAIRELGEVPSGHLYARLMGVMDLARYEKIIGILVKTGLVKRTGQHLLIWVEPTKS